MNYNSFRITSVLIGIPLGIALSNTVFWGLGVGIILGQAINVYLLVKELDENNMLKGLHNLRSGSR